MRTRIRWLLLLAVLGSVPATAHAQIDVPPVIFTGPLSHPRYDTGGPYVAAQMLYMKTNRPLKTQPIAYRGFLDLDGTFGTQGAFIGSREEALNVNQVIGPGSWQPGWDLRVGYRFENGMVLEGQWRHLAQAHYFAQAALIPPNLNVGSQFENTFLTAFVNGFGTDYAGNDVNVAGGSIATTFGIWNAASLMQINYVQRFDIYGLNLRMPIWETERYRNYGLLGPRIVWIFDRFTWRTVDEDDQGQSGPDTVALYSNTISNRMYGVHFGNGHDWFFGDTPIGGFAGTLEFEGGLYLDMVKTRAAWDREDRAVGSRRGRRFFPLSPAVEMRAGLWWYPWEGISIQVGYEFQGYFNTIASHRPIDFNVSSLDPEYNFQFLRFFHGLHFGINFVF